jgi:hypothetical protein
MIQRFTEFLEREAGYELLSLLLIIGGMVLVDGPQRALAADRLVTFGLGVMARSMGGRKLKRVARCAIFRAPHPPQSSPTSS